MNSILFHAAARKALDPRLRGDDAYASILHRQPSLAPLLHAAVERGGAQKAQAAQRRRSERRDLAELAIHHDAECRVGQVVIDAELELAARQMARAGDM